MKGIFAAAFLISVVPGIIAPAAAVATILPILADPTYFGNMQYGYWDGLEQLGSANNPFVGGDIHLSGSAVSSASADLWVDLSEPTLKVSGATAGGIVAVSVAGDINLIYQFEVVGADGSAAVEVKASGLTTATGTYQFVENHFTVGEVGLPLVIDESLDFVGSWQVNGTYLFPTNVPITVSMLVSGESEINGGFGSYSASIDPIFSVDSSSGYQLVFSPGIGNVPGTIPEPSTWAMILIGFAGLGFAGYRRSWAPTAA